MPIDDATLVVSIRDALSTKTKTMASSLGSLDESAVAASSSLKALDKALIKAEGSATAFAAAIKEASIGTKSFNTQVASSGKVSGTAATGMNRTVAALDRVEAKAGEAAVGLEAYTRAAASAGTATLSSAGSVASPVKSTVKTAATPVVSAGSAGASRALAAANNEVASSASRAATASTGLRGALSGVASMSNSTRYALFSVSQTLTKLGVGMLALPIISTAVAISFQRDFANVQRTVQGAGDKIKNELIDLSTQIPVSFKKLSEIATIGGQLGEGAADIIKFTTVVAKLTATTNLTADEAGTLVGRFQSMAHLPRAEFDGFASAVLKVGVTSVATEKQISTISTSLAGIGQVSGLTIPQIIGLSGALASVLSTTRQAQSSANAITRFMVALSGQVKTGGDGLRTFAKVAGTTSADVQARFGTAKFSGLFNKFIAGLNDTKRTGLQVQDVLASLGLTGVTDQRIFLNLAKATGLLNKETKNAISAFATGGKVLNEQYGLVAATASSHIQELGNSILATFNKLGSATTGPIVALADSLKGLVDGISDFASTDSGQMFLELAAGVTVAGGAFLLLGGLLAKGVAAGQAFALAYGSIRALMTGSAAATTEAAAATNGLAAAEGRAAISAQGYTASTTEAAAATGRFSGVASAASAVLSGPMLFALAAIAGIAGANAITDLKQQLEGVRATSSGVAKAAEKGAGALNKLSSFRTTETNLFVTTLDKANDGLYRLGKNASNFMSGVNDFGHSLTGFDAGGVYGNIDKLDKAFANLAKHGDAKKAAAEFKQLSQGWTEGGRSASELMTKLPQYTAALQDNKQKSEAQVAVQKQMAAAAGVTLNAYTKLQEGFFAATGTTKTKDLNKVISDTVSTYTKSIQPLTDFNSVVGQVQKGLQEQAQKAGTTYDGISVSLDQYTAALSGNADTANNWLTGIQTISTSLGAVGPQIANQLLTAGYSATNNSILQQMLNATPAQRDALIAATTAAMDANSLAAGEALITAGSLVTDTGGQIGADTAKKMGAMLQAGFDPATIMAQNNVKFKANPGVPDIDPNPAKKKIKSITDYANSQNPWMHVHADTGPSQSEIDQLVRNNDGRRINVYVVTNSGGGVLPGQTMVPQGATGGYFSGGRFEQGFSGGGYTGPGGKYQPAGLVHKGEFVFDKQSTSSIGVHTLMAMMRSQRGSSPASPRGSYASGGPVNPLGSFSGPVVVQLSPYDRLLLERNGNPRVVIPGTAIADANNRAAVEGSTRRAN